MDANNIRNANYLIFIFLFSFTLSIIGMFTSSIMNMRIQFILMVIDNLISCFMLIIIGVYSTLGIEIIKLQEQIHDLTNRRG